MAIPEPPFELVNHCSTVWNNTLYVYSPQGFASLPLEEGAEWQELESGQSVTGAQCVPALNGGVEALYIVGGTPDASGALSNYSGLQRYSFNSGAWETITPASAITQNRVKHGAAYIASSNSILVYAGTQDAGASGLGQQTFLVSTAAPYDVLSFNSQGAPALTSPMIMPFTTEQAVMIGGSADNTEVWTFGTPQGWTRLGTSLPPGLALNSPTKQCTIMAGVDGSRVLQIFDVGVSPNTVTRYALLGAGGAPAPVGQEIGAAAASRRRRRFGKRDLTIADWPAYNSTLAPTTTRSSFSLAEGTNNIAVISGGSTDEPIAMFDQNENTWLNATDILVAKDQIILNSVSTSSSSASSTIASSTAAPSSTTSSAPSSSATAAVAGTGQSKDRVLTTLGATLGAIFGIAAILIIILLLLRWKKQKQRRAGGGRANEKEDRLSFADQGADFMKEAGGTRGRAFSSSKSANSSLTSLQIFQNKALGHKRGVPSDSSQAPITKNKSPLGVSDPLEMSQISQRSSPTFTNKSLDIEKSDELAPRSTGLTPAAAVAGKDDKDGRTRSNGWSRYFANNDVTNLASMQGGGRNTYQTEVSEVSKSSDYGDSRPSQSAGVRPLELNLGPKFEGQRLSAVNTGSPTMGRSHEDIQQGLSAEIRRAGSTSSRGSHDGFEFSSNPTPATQSTWTPNSTTYASRPSDARSIGSSYSGSNPFFGSTSEMDPRNRKGSNGAPALPQLNLRNYGDASRDSTASAVTIFPSGLDSPKAHAFAPKRSEPATNDYNFPLPRMNFGEQNRDSAASNVTIFPGAPAPALPTNYGLPSTPRDRSNTLGKRTPANEDMSWVNINAGKAV